MYFYVYRSQQDQSQANKMTSRAVLIRRDDYYYHRYPPPDFPYQSLQRQRSFDNYYEGKILVVMYTN